MTPEEAALLVLDLTGQEPTRLARMGYGHFNVTYDAALPDGARLIVRTNRRDPLAMAGTEPNIAALRALGLPVPTVLAADLTCARHPAAYVLLERIPGRDLGFELAAMTRPQLARLAEQLCGFQDRASTLPRGRGYGWAAVGEAAPHPSWPALVEHEVAKVLANAGPLAPPGAGPRLRAALGAFADELAAVEPLPYLDDLTTKNVLIQDGELRGVVDFDWIGYGDSRYWLGLTQTAVAVTPAPEGAFYVDELCRLRGVTARERRLIAAYSALFALDFLGHTRPDGVAGLRELFERFLTEATGHETGA